MTHASSSVRRPVSRRPVRLSSTPSANRSLRRSAPGSAKARSALVAGRAFAVYGETAGLRRGIACPRPAGRPTLAPPRSTKLDPMSRLFGTDGVRGLANGLLTAELALQLAQAAAVVLAMPATTEPAARRGGTRPARQRRVPRGRRGGGALQLRDRRLRRRRAADPGRRLPVADLDADFGVMISASHNPAPDNGIKFFARGGQKLPDDVEDAIEEQLGKEPFRPVGGEVGRIQRFSDAEDRYVVHLLGTLPHRLDGLKVVLDCAHGAASGCLPPGLQGRRRRRDRHRRRTGRPQHQRRRRVHPPRPAASAPSSTTARTSASPTTATPTAASRWTTKATKWTATRSWRSSPSR